MPEKRWPPPGYPLVEGDLAITDDWEIALPERFARRVENGDLVLWRPGITIWLAAWVIKPGESREQRFATLRDSAHPAAFAQRVTQAGGLIRFTYRMRDEAESDARESLYAFVINDKGHLQLAVYYDDPAEEATAYRLVERVSERREHNPPLQTAGSVRGGAPT